MGDDKAALRSVSPVHNAEKIKARVLLIHGDSDRRVPIEHAEALRDAMTAKGNPPEWLVESDEGHGFLSRWIARAPTVRTARRGALFGGRAATHRCARVAD